MMQRLPSSFASTQTALKFVTILLLSIPPAIRAQETASPTDQNMSTTSTSDVSSATSTPSSSETTTSSDGRVLADGVGISNLWYIAVAIISVAIIAGILLILRRRKQKKSLAAANSQNVLATDLERIGGSRLGRVATGFRRLPGGEIVREEGLDDRGEAPPDYFTATKSKPPSISLSEYSTSTRTVGDGGEISREESSVWDQNIDTEVVVQDARLVRLPARLHPVVLPERGEERNRV